MFVCREVHTRCGQPADVCGCYQCCKYHPLVIALCCSAREAVVEMWCRFSSGVGTARLCMHGVYRLMRQ
jgi:hypothetical protein